MHLRPFDRFPGLQIAVEVARQGERLIFAYTLAGDNSDLVLPPPAERVRTDCLWQATCFEAFIGTGPTSYIELNFAPSGQWAAYAFSDYRQGMRELDLPPPTISLSGSRVEADVELPTPMSAPLGLSAVLEHKDGTRTYWALAHPGGNRPDFHARDCFIARLP